ncbi:MAG: SPFH domain-containing protein [Methanomassiliicoccaceae archaeon]|jgi:membrane protease subunit (stomatin/prohibitin family)|nr:SPFH domain-containing protein [Euryarchaeota archaeon]HOB37455.1 SPFH domain-containing protein [Methanomassiliicoccaceae archaeon]HOL07932.1 SPFH domain-containing protein [Methanomassiliicoccaceae archaeon]HOQ26024.1 SPFH domain-containing protein [Methanomassiliicoccaceae archaeon]HQA21359.1 SPFH domain-containing protein [Methanomassiliicoccaceae archaeon]
MSLIGADTFKWEDADKRGNIMFRLPRNIRWNDNIVVREDEIAVFYRDGKVLAYIDRPDRYALSSLNDPIVGRIVKALSGAQQQAEVIYLQKRVFDGKFGSKQPYQFRDPEFGVVNLRVFGEFRYKVSSPENFVNQFVGTFNYATSAEVESRIKEQMVILVYNIIGEMKDQGMGVADLASSLMNIEQGVLAKSDDQFGPYGLDIDKISGLYISLPDEVQRAVDTRASMQVLGTNYMGYQTGQAMREAASNPAGGAAGAGVGVGAGIGMGWTMVDQMRGAGQSQQPSGGGQGSPPPFGPTVKCPKCGTMNPSTNKFCSECGHRFEPDSKCPKCGSNVPGGSKFCPNCGNPMGNLKCPNCNAEVPASSKFCPNCGNPMK